MPHPDSDLNAPIFGKLQPAHVWAHFATLCRIPRPSKGEDRLREHLRQWALGRGLTATVDAAGNLILRKPASRGRENAPGVVLQAHLDMVCQKNAGSAHDFARDPIQPRLADGWLLAEETTLGADNGIGAALALAALEDSSLVHGPLTALLTVDEEDGMGGARGLAAGALDARLMLNLDSEDWGDLFVGCAGGLDINVSRPGSPTPLPAGYGGWRIELAGLRGGHSGLDIHSGRGNAIKLLVRVLRDLESRWPLRLASLHGGSARNALPREAQASFALPASADGNSGADLAGELSARLSDWQELLRKELRGTDDRLTLRLLPARLDALMAASEQAIWLASLHAAPHGVRRWSPDFPGVVETSNNLGMVTLEAGHGRCNFMVRSLADSGSQALADEIVSLFSLTGTLAEKSGHYPGWAPDPASPLLALCQSVYRREFAAEPRVQVIHAGLECGIIAAKHPGIDTVSFGPTIRGAHAPGERVDVASVARTWQLLTAILAAASEEAAA